MKFRMSYWKQNANYKTQNMKRRTLAEAGANRKLLSVSDHLASLKVTCLQHLKGNTQFEMKRWYVICQRCDIDFCENYNMFCSKICSLLMCRSDLCIGKYDK